MLLANTDLSTYQHAEECHDPVADLGVIPQSFPTEFVDAFRDEVGSSFELFMQLAAAEDYMETDLADRCRILNVTIDEDADSIQIICPPAFVVASTGAREMRYAKTGGYEDVILADLRDGLKVNPARCFEGVPEGLPDFVFDDTVGQLAECGEGLPRGRWHR